MDEFKRYHPLGLILYFISLFLIIMIVMHPVVLLIALTSSIILNFLINKKGFIQSLLMYFIIFMVIFITNPIFSRNGTNILFSIGKINYYYESLYYGAMIGLMIISMISWFRYYNEIVTDDKFTYLFGKVFPSISLIISMGLRMIPYFNKKMKRLNDAEKSIGLLKTNLLNKIKNSLRKITSLVTWSLENAIDNADAMKARGYGIGKRTSFTIFKFKKSDGLFIFIWLGLIGITVYSIIMNYTKYDFYPIADQLIFDYPYFLIYLNIFLLFYFPFFIELKEAIRWHYLKSKI